MASDFTGQKCGIYPRVSSVRQADEDKTSLDVQTANCRRYAAQREMLVDELCVRREAHTSTESDRPELNRLLADMVQRDVRNLIIDLADRLTREGQLAAALFLSRFIESGITLHVASMNLVVRDSMGIMQFLNLAFAAQLDNSYRAERNKANRRALAQDRGHYARGNRAPYGWRYVVDDEERGRWKRFHFEPDTDEYGGTFTHLVQMIRLRQQGLSWRKIADALTTANVPTPRAHHGHKHAPRVWPPNTVRELVLSPMNEGRATSIRETWSDWNPPDAKHPKRWRTRVPLPAAQHIALPNGTVVGAPLTHAEAEALRTPGTRIGGDGPSVSPWAGVALLRGGMAKCAMPGPHGPCGGTLVFHAAKRKSDGLEYPTYTCRTHGTQPHACPGLTANMNELDDLVWAKVRTTLLTPGALEQLAAEQAAQDASGNPASDLANLRRTRKQLAEQCDNLDDAIRHAPSAFVRDRLMHDLAQLEPAIVEADKKIEDAEVLARDDEQRRRVLSDVQMQAERYRVALTAGDDTPDEIDDALAAVRRSILAALGVKVLVRRLPDYSLDAVVDIQLRRGRVVPWFLPPEQLDLQPGQEAGTLSLERITAALAGAPDYGVTFTPPVRRPPTTAEGSCLRTYPASIRTANTVMVRVRIVA